VTPRACRALLACGLAIAAVAAPAAQAASGPLSIDGRVRQTGQSGADLLQQGRFAGSPLGSGRLDVRTTIGEGRGALVNFLMTTSRGSVRGYGNVTVTFRGSLVIYSGTARIVRGRGVFRHMRARRLRVSGRGVLSSDTFAVHIRGRARW
jgi:hypothetical protein